MTISKTDLDAFIGREADKHTRMINGTAIELRICREGAQLLAPLLLQAVEALKEIGPIGSQVEGGIRYAQIAEQALTQIEAALKGEE